MSSKGSSSKFDKATKYLRINEVVVWSCQLVLTIVIGALLIYRLRTRMYLYYVDFKRKLLINICGVIVFLLLMLVNMLIKDDNKK